MATNELENLKTLAKKVAEHLSGRPCEVRFRPPAMNGTMGCAMKSAGVGIIDIDPSWPVVEVYKALLHEISHIRNDWDILLEETVILPPASVDFEPGEYKALRAQPSEVRARECEWEWLKFADYYRFRFTKSFPGEVIPRLAALLEWTPESKKII